MASTESALRVRQDKVRFIQVRHEESAAFMACGYAKFTGRLGVCLATSGPGGIHLLNGLYDANMDGDPVLAITGLQFHDLIGSQTQQDVALDKLFIDVAAINERVMGPNHVENPTDLAVRTALSYHGEPHYLPGRFSAHGREKPDPVEAQRPSSHIAGRG
jgi:pyruvate dehydrogenase (quinone)/pyruvate oxidase